MEVEGAGEGVTAAAGGIVLIAFFLLALVSIAAMVWAIADIVRNQRLTGGEKAMWILIVLVLNLVGVAVYAVVGRQNSRST